MRYMILTLVLCFLLTSVCSAASPHDHLCDGINQQISAKEKKDLSPVLIKDLSTTDVPPTKRVRIVRSLRLSGWSILYVDTWVSDSVYMFFSNDPLTTPLLTMFGGDASPDEYEDIVNWAMTHAPGIPDPLARCFARYVSYH